MTDRQAIAKQARRRATAVAEELPRIVEELKTLGAERVILFGSEVKGRPKPWSDVDLLVVIPSEMPFVERIADLYGRLRPRMAVDLLPYTPSEFKRGNPIIKMALAGGKILYEKPRE
jgi:predicted nucleotidyltransferase